MMESNHFVSSLQTLLSLSFLSFLHLRFKKSAVSSRSKNSLDGSVPVFFLSPSFPRCMSPLKDNGTRPVLSDPVLFRGGRKKGDGQFFTTST